MSTQQLLGIAPQEAGLTGQAGLRQAALLLHAMHEADRQWLLDQLPTSERHQVTSLLEELQVLGIPRSPDFLESAIAQPETGHESAAPQGEPLVDEPTSLVRALDKIPSHERAPAWVELCGVFKDEPAGLLAQLLYLHDWSWRDAALRSLDPRKRARVQELSANSGALDAPDLHAALLEAVAAHVLQAESVLAHRAANVSARPAANRWAWWPWRGRAEGALHSA